MKEFAFTYRELSEKLDVLEKQYNKKFEDVYEAIRYLLKKEEEPEERKRVGFKQKV